LALDNRAPVEKLSCRQGRPTTRLRLAAAWRWLRDPGRPVAILRSRRVAVILGAQFVLRPAVLEMVLALSLSQQDRLTKARSVGTLRWLLALAALAVWFRSLLADRMTVWAVRLIFGVVRVRTHLAEIWHFRLQLAFSRVWFSLVLERPPNLQRPSQ
jgi:hypothetical protein